MNPIVTIEVPGRLDAAASPAFLDFAAALVQAGAARVVLDLSLTTYLGSAGIRAILRLRQEATARGGRVVLLNCRPTVQEVLRICGLADDPVQVESIEAARKCF